MHDSTSSDNARITVLSRPGCHLCEDALAVLEPLAEEFGTTIRKVDISQKPALLQRYSDMVPVFVIDGREVGHWRISPERARRALERTPAPAR